MKIGKPVKDVPVKISDISTGEVFSAEHFSSYYMKIPDTKVEGCIIPANAVNLNTGHLSALKPDLQVTEIQDAYLAFGGDK